jgi:hypothetical protein
MTTDIDTSAIIEKSGILVGPYRRPRNLSANERGSIHDDATAQKLGFRGGTVAGSIHMDQFPPLLVRAFGQRWFETGSLSTYFRNATTDGEPVRALSQSAPAATDAQIRVWMEKDDDTSVLEGTAAVGSPAEPSMLQLKLAEPRDPGDQRILATLRPGATTEAIPVRLRTSEIAPRPRLITEPLAWYTGRSPWGGPIAPPSLAVHLMAQEVQPGFRIERGPVVGLYGAIEVRHVNGPVFVEHDYEAQGAVLAVGSTPKTEYFWFETALREPAAGALIAEMTMMLRFMKASSPLWAVG